MDVEMLQINWPRQRNKTKAARAPLFLDNFANFEAISRHFVHRVSKNHENGRSRHVGRRNQALKLGKAGGGGLLQSPTPRLRDPARRDNVSWEEIVYHPSL